MSPEIYFSGHLAERLQVKEGDTESSLRDSLRDRPPTVQSDCTPGLVAKQMHLRKATE